MLRGVLNSGYERGGVSSICVRRGNEISYAGPVDVLPQGHRRHRAVAGYGRQPFHPDSAKAKGTGRGR